MTDGADSWYLESAEKHGQEEARRKAERDAEAAQDAAQQDSANATSIKADSAEYDAALAEVVKHNVVHMGSAGACGRGIASCACMHAISVIPRLQLQGGQKYRDDWKGNRALYVNPQR